MDWLCSYMAEFSTTSSKAECRCVKYATILSLSNSTITVSEQAWTSAHQLIKAELELEGKSTADPSETVGSLKSLLLDIWHLAQNEILCSIPDN